MQSKTSFHLDGVPSVIYPDTSFSKPGGGVYSVDALHLTRDKTLLAIYDRAKIKLPGNQAGFRAIQKQIKKGPESKMTSCGVFAALLTTVIS